MEEAKISGENTASVVTTDDLLMLIGARTVEALNYERLFKEALRKVQGVQELQNRVSELEHSLHAASEHSASLDRALTEARRQVQSAIKRAEKAENEVIELERARASLEGKLDSAQEEIKQLRKEIKTLSSRKKEKKK